MILNLDKYVNEICLILTKEYMEIMILKLIDKNYIDTLEYFKLSSILMIKWNKLENKKKYKTDEIKIL